MAIIKQRRLSKGDIHTERERQRKSEVGRDRERKNNINSMNLLRRVWNCKPLREAKARAHSIEIFDESCK